MDMHAEVSVKDRRVSLLALAFVVTLGIAGTANAQQDGSSTTRSTPGVLPGTTGTTYSTPGAPQTPSTPGGTVPIGASTQDKSNLPSNPRNYNNSAPRRSR
jgi:hypothetical protein